MMTRRIFSIALVCAMALTMTSCKSWWKSKKSTSASNLNGDNLGLLTDSAGAGGLPPRSEFDGKSAVAGQFDAVLFAFDSATVDETERPAVEKIAEMLKASAAAVVVCEGNCDERGSNEYNMSLGERRALAVRAYLMSLGVDGNRIQTKSYGEEKPKDPAQTEEAYRINRRVEFVVLQN
jgi:peptidoglycan-associated lipoprotein